ncbi:hypothetical protein Tco_0230554, partial [Tanacetum coccineum]
MMVMVKVKENVLDVVIQITSLENVQSRQITTIKVHLLEDNEATIGEDEVEKTKDETCLVAQAPDEICLGIILEPDEWIKDSGCSKHMT